MSSRTAVQRCLIVLANVVVLAGVTSPVHAQVCGNGNINVGEQCDDGNLLDDDCCSHLCRLVAVGTVCRPSIDPCDAAEVCQGDGLCPVDTGILGDPDGDGFCEAVDVCPGLSDPGQVDRDGDGIGDACDPCTNVYPGVIENAKLRLQVPFPEGKERLKFRGTMRLPPDTSFDPRASGLRFMITDGVVGATSVDVTLPAGDYNAALRQGWRSNDDQTSWSFADHLGSAGGIKRATIRGTSTSSGEFQFSIVGQNGLYGLPVSEPVVARVILAPPNAVDGQCAESVFVPGECFVRSNDTKLICH
jgi:cysteine-rich repeat protein